MRLRGDRLTRKASFDHLLNMVVHARKPQAGPQVTLGLANPHVTLVSNGQGLLNQSLWQHHSFPAEKNIHSNRQLRPNWPERSETLVVQWRPLTRTKQSHDFNNDSIISDFLSHTRNRDGLRKLLSDEEEMILYIRKLSRSALEQRL